MTRSADEIERDVEATRAGLDETVEALKNKMSPGQLIDELTQSLKGAGAGDMFHNLGGQVKENPMALAMIGAGMAWLMMGKGGSKTPDVAQTSTGGFYTDLDSPQATTSSGLASQAADAASGLKDKVADVASHLKEGVTGAADNLRAGAHSAAHGATGMGRSAAGIGQKVQRGFMDSLDQEPLVIGAIGVAIGAAIGASMPSTRLEDATFGKSRDRVLDEAKSRAREGVDMAQDAVEAAYTGAQAAAQEQGLVGGEDGSLADKAGTVIRAGLDAAKDRVANQGH